MSFSINSRSSDSIIPSHLPGINPSSPTQTRDSLSNFRPSTTSTSSESSALSSPLSEQGKEIAGRIIVSPNSAPLIDSVEKTALPIIQIQPVNHTPAVNDQRLVEKVGHATHNLEQIIFNHSHDRRLALISDYTQEPVSPCEELLGRIENWSNRNATKFVAIGTCLAWTFILTIIFNSMSGNYLFREK